MFLSAVRRQAGHCKARTQAKIKTIKRRRSLRIFSAHITRNAMQIEVSEVDGFYWTDSAPDIVNPGQEGQSLVSV